MNEMKTEEESGGTIVPTAWVEPETPKEEVPLSSEVKEEEHHPVPMSTIVERLVPPHNKKSRKVTEEDLDVVIEEAKILYTLCVMPVGRYMGGYAAHHSQINNTDPLDFFVTVGQAIIINPVILSHSNYVKDSKEACLTFSDRDPVIVDRWQKCEVEFVSIMIDPEDNEKYKLSSTIQDSLSGRDAWVFEHEVAHGQGEYIYKD